MFTIHSFPRAILHLDADSFFVSCEQALRPELKGKPVVCGKERGIAVAMSSEAKASGVTRGMPMHDIKKICPNVVLIESDYETYSLFSKRMFVIIRRYIDVVEEYSIDEAFMDITGLQGPLHLSYLEIAARLQQEIEHQLGISVSVGLAPTKVLAKVASSMHKPHGFMAIEGKEIHRVLEHVPVGKIWGIGKNTAAYCGSLKIFTALQFANCSSEFIAEHFPKPIQELHQELRGVSIFPVVPEEKTSYVSISKTYTFGPSSSDRSYVWSEVIKNLEGACAKARRYGLGAMEVVVMLKTKNFVTQGFKAKVTRASCHPNELINSVQQLFDAIWDDGETYRATGIVLANLREYQPTQISLFESVVHIERMQKLYAAIDMLGSRFGIHTVHMAASLPARTNIPVQTNVSTSTSQNSKISLRVGQSPMSFFKMPMVLGSVC